MKPLSIPVVNLNGTDKRSLVDQNMNVAHGCRDLLKIMGVAYPHGRDYQHLIKGNDWSEHYRVLDEAQRAWSERYELVKQIADEFEQLAVDIHEQGSSLRDANGLSTRGAAS